MRKLFQLMCAVVLVGMSAACSSEFEESGKENKSQANEKPSFSKRTVNDAIEIASKYGKLKSSLTRGQELTVDPTTVKSIVASSTRSTTDTLIYAVNYSDDNGYLLISANKSTEPILAIVESGSYIEDKEARPESFSYFLDQAVGYIESAAIRPSSNSLHPGDPSLIDGPVDFLMEWYNDTIKSQSWSGARVKVNWGQFWPENIYCPNKVAGCGPVAIAQAVSYFKPNLSFDLTFDNRSSDRMVIDWNQILTHKRSTTLKYPKANDIDKHVVSCNQNYKIHDDLAAFLRQIGVWCYSNYKYDSTSTEVADFFYVASNLLSDYTKVSVTGNNCYDKIKSSGIVLMTGVCDEGGHAWVIDGVGNIDYDIYRYYCYNPKTHEYKDLEIIYKSSKYVHCNWGWAGQDNGYFLIGVYDTYTGLNTIEHHENRYNFTRSLCGYAYLP